MRRIFLCLALFVSPVFAFDKEEQAIIKLYERINHRVDLMLEIGLVDEVKTLDRQVILGENSVYQLTLSGVKNYVAVWSVNDDSVLTIDKNGKITARQPGVACVTSQIGTTVLYC